MATMRQAALWALRCAVTTGAIVSTMTTGYGADDSAATSQQVQELKQQLADQQKQIEELRMLLVGQQKKIESASNPAPTAVPVETPAPVAAAPQKSVGEVASLTSIMPALPPAAPRPAAIPLPQPPQPAKPADPSANPCEANPEGQSPAFLRLGSTCLIPVGFMDLTSVWRDKNAGSSMGSNYGSIPYNNG